MEQNNGCRVVVLSRYCLADQYDLAAEFGGMLKILASKNEVMHLSLKGKGQLPEQLQHVQIEEMPLKVNRNSPRDIQIKSLLFYVLLPMAALRIRRFKPDVIFLSEIIPMAGLLLKWMTGARVATAYGDWHIHNILGSKPWSKPLLTLAEKLDTFEVRRLNGFFCRAITAGERLKKMGVPAESISVVRDAPDPESFSPRDASALRLKCGFKEQDVVLLYHGVMHSGKGLDKLIAWVSDLYTEDNRIGLILVGGGPEETALRTLANRLPISSRAHFTGWLKTTNEVGDYCNAADICIAMRTATEANERVVPGALLHSMACRKIVVGPRLSGIAEILKHEENGFMFSPDDGDDFKKLIRDLIARRKQWSTFAEAAYQDIQKNYSVQAAAEQYAAAIIKFAKPNKA